jgi:hypothetical protein
MYVMAIFAFYFFGPQVYENKEDPNIVPWNSLLNCMYTLWSYVTADGWVAFQVCMRFKVWGFKKGEMMNGVNIDSQLILFFFIIF